MQATLTTKGRITLPLALRRKLLLKAGDIVEFHENTFRKDHPRFVNERKQSSSVRGKKATRGQSS